MGRTFPLGPQFFVTAPQPCPYREGFFERKLFTSLAGRQDAALADALSHKGFRRSQNMLYRPTCPNCSACLSVRIAIEEFAPSRSQRRVVRRNRDLTAHVSPPWATKHLYRLFKQYLRSRHTGGGMSEMDASEFKSMIEETPALTRIMTYTEPQNGDRPWRVVGASLTDVLSDGLSMVYSFFDPHSSGRSLGTYMILHHIQMAKKNGLSYVYLGYWVPGSPKMDYKSRFSGLEVYYRGAWQRREDIRNIDTAPDPRSREPLSRQVAALGSPREPPEIAPPTQGRIACAMTDRE